MKRNVIVLSVLSMFFCCGSVVAAGKKQVITTKVSDSKAAAEVRKSALKSLRNTDRPQVRYTGRLFNRVPTPGYQAYKALKTIIQSLQITGSVTAEELVALAKTQKSSAAGAGQEAGLVLHTNPMQAACSHQPRASHTEVAAGTGLGHEEEAARRVSGAIDESSSASASNANSAAHLVDLLSDAAAPAQRRQSISAPQTPPQASAKRASASTLAPAKRRSQDAHPESAHVEVTPVRPSTAGPVDGDLPLGTPPLVGTLNDALDDAGDSDGESVELGEDQVSSSSKVPFKEGAQLGSPEEPVAASQTPLVIEATGQEVQNLSPEPSTDPLPAHSQELSASVPQAVVQGKVDHSFKTFTFRDGAMGLIASSAALALLIARANHEYRIQKQTLIREGKSFPVDFKTYLKGRVRSMTKTEWARAVVALAAAGLVGSALHHVFVSSGSSAPAA